MTAQPVSTSSLESHGPTPTLTGRVVGPLLAGILDGQACTLLGRNLIVNATVEHGNELVVTSTPQPSLSSRRDASRVDARQLGSDHKAVRFMAVTA